MSMDTETLEKHVRALLEFKERVEKGGPVGTSMSLEEAQAATPDLETFIKEGREAFHRMDEFITIELQKREALEAKVASLEEQIAGLQEDDGEEQPEQQADPTKPPLEPNQAEKPKDPPENS